MEEKKVKNTKPSYEELNDFCNQLAMQNKQLSIRLQQVMDVQNKLPYLFKILENRTFFTQDYLDATVLEITRIMPPYSEEESENTPEESPEN